MPVHDGNELGLPCRHWDVGDVCAPDLVSLIDLLMAQAISVDLVSFGRDTELCFRSYRLDFHDSHQLTESLSAYLNPLICELSNKPPLS